MLPLVHRNLTLAGEDDPLLPRLKGIRRKTGREQPSRRANRRDRRSPARRRRTGSLRRRRHRRHALLSLSSGCARPRSCPCSWTSDTPRRRSRTCAAGWLARPSVSSGNGEIGHLVDTSGNTLALRTRVAVDFVRRGPGEPGPAALWGTAEHPTSGASRCSSPRRPRLSRRRARIRAFRRRVEDAVDRRREDAARRRDRLAATRRPGVRARARSEAPRRAPVSHLAPWPNPARGGRGPAGAVRRRRVSAFRTAAPRARIRGVGALPSTSRSISPPPLREPLRVVATFPRHLRDRWHLSRTWHCPSQRSSVARGGSARAYGGQLLTHGDGRPHLRRRAGSLDRAGSWTSCRSTAARATFFVIGSACEARADVLGRILDEGHEVEPHVVPPLARSGLRRRARGTSWIGPM